eukprot:scaffold75567_cov22-Tisochrysis_lutea.AAC.2
MNAAFLMRPVKDTCLAEETLPTSIKEKEWCNGRTRQKLMRNPQRCSRAGVLQKMPQMSLCAQLKEPVELELMQCNRINANP